MTHLLAQVPPAPVIVEIPWAAIGMVALLSYLVARALKAGYGYTLGAFLLKLADVLKIDAWKVHVDFGGKIRAINDALEDAIAAWAQASETLVGKWWYGQKKIVEWTYDAIRWEVSATVDALQNVVQGVIPDQVAHGTRTVTHTVTKVKTVVKSIERTTTIHIAANAKALRAELEADFGRAWRGIDYIRAHAIPQLWRGIHALDADVAAVKRWETKVGAPRLSRLEKALGATVLGGVAVAALTRVFPYWQCSNVRRFNKGLCRSPLGSLDWLFALAGSAVLVLDPKLVIETGEELEGLLEGAFRSMADL